MHTRCYALAAVFSNPATPIPATTTSATTASIICVLRALRFAVSIVDRAPFVLVVAAIVTEALAPPELWIDSFSTACPVCARQAKT